jgi:succinoglycan biosynthesis protein ExoL
MLTQAKKSTEKLGRESASKVVYVVSDVFDPAVLRRTNQLVEGARGAKTIEIVGLVRTRYRQIPDMPNGVRVRIAGSTADRALWSRLHPLICLGRELSRQVQATRGSCIVIAKNLDCAFIALLVVAVFRSNQTNIVYEVLDIHPLLTKQSVAGTIARFLERLVLRHCSAIIVSSDGFVRGYFSVKVSDFDKRKNVVLVENKLPSMMRARRADYIDKLELSEPSDRIRIGYFGTLRCLNSLKALIDIAHRSTDVCVNLAGSSFKHGDWLRAQLASQMVGLVDWRGAYTYPDDLMALYSDVDIVWAIDESDQSLNCTLLMPNRFYEALYFNKPIIVKRGTEVARRAEELGVAVVVESISAEHIAAGIECFKANRRSYWESCRKVDLSVFCEDPSDPAGQLKALFS